MLNLKIDKFTTHKFSIIRINQYGLLIEMMGGGGEKFFPHNMFYNPLWISCILLKKINNKKMYETKSYVFLPLDIFCLTDVYYTWGTLLPGILGNPEQWFQQKTTFWKQGFVPQRSRNPRIIIGKKDILIYIYIEKGF